VLSQYSGSALHRCASRAELAAVILPYLPVMTTTEVWGLMDRSRGTGGFSDRMARCSTSSEGISSPGGYHHEVG
jgi:hypothetical protein